MTEEQRVRLEELITEYGNSEWNLGMEANPTSISKARDRITDYLDTIPNLLDKKGRLSRITEGLMRKNRREEGV